MLNEILNRLEANPKSTAWAMAASILIAGLDVFTSLYLVAVFRRVGDPGFVAWVAALSGGLLFLLGWRWALSSGRSRILRTMLAGGAEGDVALIDRAARVAEPKVAGALGAAESVIDAFSASAMAAVMDLPLVLLFATAIFFVAGPAAGVASALVLAGVGLRSMRAGAKNRIVGLDLMRAKVKLQSCQDAAERVRLAHDVHALRSHLDHSGSRERNLSAAAGGLVLLATVGCGAMFGDGSNLSTLIAGNILAGRALGTLSGAVGSLSRMQSAMPAANALRNEISA